MDQVEAQEVLARELSAYRDWTYDQLRELIAQEKIVTRVTGPSGVLYYVDIRASWHSWWRKTVVVFGAIDDGRGWSPFLPMSDGFIKAPDGSFVGED